MASSCSTPTSGRCWARSLRTSGRSLLPRPLGLVVYTLGCSFNGTLGRATELLHLVPTERPIASIPRPQISATASAEALEWWTGRLSELFGVLTDLAIFTDNCGIYHPTKHLHALLTTEQLFRRVGSIQTGDRDATGRRVLLFTVADTLERLTGWSIEKLCSLRFARQRLSRLEAQVPATAAPILLPGARRAVRALEMLHDGFHTRGHDGDADDHSPPRRRRDRHFRIPTRRPPATSGYYATPPTAMAPSLRTPHSSRMRSSLTTMASSRTTSPCSATCICSTS